MQLNKTATAIAICLIAAVLALSILYVTEHSETRSHKPVTGPDLYYSKAAAEINTHSNIQFTVNEYQILRTGKNDFRSASEQTVLYDGSNPENPEFHVTETLSMGSHTVNLDVTYSDGILFQSIDGNNFTGPVDTSFINSQYAPTLLLNPANYRTIHGLQVGNSTIIHFFDAVTPEDWANIGSGIFQNAWATVWLNSRGELTKCTYRIYYTSGTVSVYQSICTQIESTEPVSIPQPNADHYLSVTDPWIPRQLEIACGYLLQANSVTSSHTDTIICELFGDTRQQNIDLLIQNNTASPVIDIKTTVSISNSSREGENTISTQTQHYDDGGYLHTIDGKPVADSADPPQQDILNRCREVLVGTILLPYHIQDAKTSHLTDTYRVEITTNSDFAQKIVSDACGALYNEPALLDDLSGSHQTNLAMCYLEFDIATGLPLYSGIHYSGTYYVSELPYDFIFEADQNYRIS